MVTFLRIRRDIRYLLWVLHGCQRHRRPKKLLFSLPSVFRIRIHLMRIRIHIQHPIRIQGFHDQKWEKMYCGKKLHFFRSKTTIYLSLGLHKGFPSYRRSLQPLKENIQNFKTMNLLIFFLLLWVIFALMDTDPLT